MASKIKLVQNDTRPFLALSVTDEVTGQPIDFSDPGTVVVVQFRAAGATTIKDTCQCQKLPGVVSDDGITVLFPPQYANPGSGGRLLMKWNTTTLDTPGEFEGDVYSTFADSTIQTSYSLLKFSVRAAFVGP